MRRYTTPVADLFTPVRLPRPAFQDLVRQVDVGVADGKVMLALHEDFPFRELSVLHEGALHIDSMPTNDVMTIVENLDQLLLLAFEHAPDDVVTNWASGRDESLIDEARDRVHFVRDNMPNLRNLWESKSDSILPPLVSFSYETIYDAKGDGAAVAVYMSAARVNGIGVPDRNDAVRLRVQLWPADVNMLIGELEHVRDTHFRNSSSGGGEGNDPPGTEATPNIREEASQRTLSEG